MSFSFTGFLKGLLIQNEVDRTKQVIIQSSSASTTGTSTTITTAQTSNRVLTLPNATDTLVGKATTDTLTNKTIDGGSNTLTNLPSSGLSGVVSIPHGGTGVSSVTVAPAATAWAGWDANSNLSANNHIEGYRTQATSNSTLNLVVGDAYQQYFTGTTASQVVKMPVTSTLVLGQQYTIFNNSTQSITVESSNGSTIKLMSASSSIMLSVINTGAIDQTAWAATYTPPFTASNNPNTAVLRDGSNSFAATTITARLIGSASTLDPGRNINGTAFDGSADITVTADAGSLTGSSLNGSVVGSALTSVGTISSGTWNGTNVAVAHGGTGASTKTAGFDALQPMTTGGDLIYGGASGTGTRLANGSAGQILTSGGTTLPPVWSSSSLVSPAGTIIMFGANTPPTGYLACDGSLANRTTYAILYSIIGNTWGNGDGATTFTLPNLNSGYFPRGGGGRGGSGNDPDSTTRNAAIPGTFSVGGGSTNGTSTITVSSTSELAVGMAITGTNIPGNSHVRAILSPTTFTLGDSANVNDVAASGSGSSITFTLGKSASSGYVGSQQGSEIPSHTHPYSFTIPLFGTVSGTSANVMAGTGANSAGSPYSSGGLATSNQSFGGSETRPLNSYVLFCIKTGL